MTKPKRTEGVQPITKDSPQRASVQNILHNILQYSAQYSARNIQRASAHNILHPVSSFPRLQSAHFLVAAINNDSCICFTTLSPGSNRRGCGRVRKKTSSPVSAADVGDHSAAAVLLLPPKEAAAASAVRRVNSGSSVNS